MIDDSLRQIWVDLCSKFSSDTALIHELYAEIERNYLGRGRHYHNLNHLLYLFNKQSAYRAQIQDIDTIQFSIFYHDIIYNAQSGDNERISANLALKRLTELGVEAEKIKRCEAQIMATKDHLNQDDNDTNYLVDFDLAILGESLDDYKSYAHQVRKEYSIYPDFMYNRGRKKVLNHFLQMPRIFKTNELFERYETQAKSNLNAELNGF